jgi:hypothetical protein
MMDERVLLISLNLEQFIWIHITETIWGHVKAASLSLRI